MTRRWRVTWSRFLTTLSGASRPELGRSFRVVGSRWGCGYHRLAAPSADGNAHGRHLIRPSGSLGRRDAGGDHVDAALSHERTGDGVRGAPPPARPLLGQRRGTLGGSKGGAASPCQVAMSTLRGLA